MTRVVAFLILIGLLALAGAWLADHPGDVAVNWMGWRIETSVMVGIIAVVVLVLSIIFLWSAARLLWRTPRAVANALDERRRRKGYLAISRGLVAIGAGDARAARRFAGEAERIAPAEPLALLLRAQTAQLAGDRAAAEEAFRAMADADETRLLGLRGLYVEAQRRADRPAARRYAEEAAAAAPALPWAGQAVLEFRCAEADWGGALEALERGRRSRLIDAATYRRRRAVLLTARALAEEEADPAAAKEAALDAAKLAPDLVPAAVLAGRLLAENGELRKAGRILEKAWRLNPHPDVAELYAHLRSGYSARDRLGRVRRLAGQAAGHPEAALALARAAVEAREFAAARAALAGLLAAPTQRVALLMAEIEEAEHGDEGRAREWMARAVRAARDPAWTADGFVSDRWMPVSPVSGRIDAFEWKVPLAELGHAEVIEGQPGRAPAPLIAASEPPRPDATPAAGPAASAQGVAAESGAVTAGNAGHSLAADARGGASTADAAGGHAPEAATEPAALPRATGPAPEPVIPLVHAPDDPGPEPETLPIGADEPPRRRFALFR